MKKFNLVLCLFLLCGCVSYPNVYNENGEAEKSLALVTGAIDPGLSVMPNTFYIRSVHDEQNNIVIDSNNLLSGHHREVKLQPGKYIINARCENRKYYANHGFPLTVEAGKKYIFSCEFTADKVLGKFGVGSTKFSYEIKVN
jgi:hypothetical protein